MHKTKFNYGICYTALKEYDTMEQALCYLSELKAFSALEYNTLHDGLYFLNVSHTDYCPPYILEGREYQSLESLILESGIVGGPSPSITIINLNILLSTLCDGSKKIAAASAASLDIFTLHRCIKRFLDSGLIITRESVIEPDVYYLTQKGSIIYRLARLIIEGGPHD